LGRDDKEGKNAVLKLKMLMAGRDKKDSVAGVSM